MHDLGVCYVVDQDLAQDNATVPVRGGQRPSEPVPLTQVVVSGGALGACAAR